MRKDLMNNSFLISNVICIKEIYKQRTHTEATAWTHAFLPIYKDDKFLIKNIILIIKNLK